MPGGAPIKALFGLGNPGLAYRKNRHNAGFLFLDHLVRQAGLPLLARSRRRHSVITRVLLAGEEILLVKPQTFMNLSGEAYRGVTAAFGLTPPETLIIHDDLALPMATFRIRQRGSDGGHRGMRSVLAAAGGAGVPRIRIGIAPAEPPPDAAEYVLSDFTPVEMNLLTGLFGTVYKALVSIFHDGMEKTMSRYN